MTAAAKKTVILKAPKLTNDERDAVNRVLKAAGVVYVTRAMTRVCTPTYTNKGWNNCFFVQMFGGPANINRLVDAYIERTGGGKGPFDFLDREEKYEPAIAEKLAADLADVKEVITLFDDNTRFREAGEWLGYHDGVHYGNVSEDTLAYGKVVSLLNHIYSWLKRRGVVFNADVSAHKRVKAQ